MGLLKNGKLITLVLLVTAMLIISAMHLCVNASTVYWTGTMEEGDESDWTADGTGNVYVTANGTPSNTTETAHTGTHCAKAVLVNVDEVSTAVRFHKFPQMLMSDPSQGYFSCWQKWPVVPVIPGDSGFSNIFQFKELSPSGTSDPTFYLDLRKDTATGKNIIQLREWQISWPAPINGIYPEINENEWFHIEAYNKLGYGTGQLKIWINGTLYWDLQNVNTMRYPDSSDYIKSWGVCAYGAYWQDDTYTAYFDDCAVSDIRLGTEYFSSPTPVYLSENTFDDMVCGSSPSGWSVITPINTTCTIDETPDTNDKSLKFTDTTTSTKAYATKTFSAVSGSVILEYRMMQPSKVLGGGVQLKSGNTVAIETYVTSDRGRDIIILKNNQGMERVIGDFLPNTWQTVKIVADTDTNKADAYLDGVLKLSGISIRNAVDSVDTIHAQSGNSGTGTVYFSYIHVVK